MKSLIFICIIFHIAAQTIAQKTIFCYWDTGAAHRLDNGQFEVSHIDPKLCTHIVYTFFGVNPDGGITYLDPGLDLTENSGQDYITKFINLKSQNPDVKLIAGIGGSNVGSEVLSMIASEPESREIFAQNVFNFLEKWELDGFDFNWEYPALMGGDSSIDKENFVLQLAELKRILFPTYLLSIAVAAHQSKASLAYDIPSISQHVNYINLKSFDLHEASDGYLGIHSALYTGPDANRMQNVDACVKYWLSRGAPRNKLVLGIPTYGRSFTLLSPEQNEIGNTVSGEGNAGKYTITPGFLGYNEICENNWPRQWESRQLVPYAFSNDQWVGYEDSDSVKIKAEYAMQNVLAGVLLMSIDTDDFRGNCGNGKFPLLTMAYNIINDIQETTTITPITTLSTDPPRELTTLLSDVTPTPEEPETTSTPQIISTSTVEATTISQVTSTAEETTISQVTSTVEETTSITTSEITSTTTSPQASTSTVQVTSTSTPEATTSQVASTTNVPPTSTSTIQVTSTSTPEATTSQVTSTTTVPPTSTSTMQVTSTSTSQITSTSAATTKIPEVTSTTVKQTTTSKTTTSGSAFICPRTGLFRDPENCTKYYSCVYGIAYSMSCPAGLYFDQSLEVCNWPYNVECNL